MDIKDPDECLSRGYRALSKFRLFGNKWEDAKPYFETSANKFKMMNK